MKGIFSVKNFSKCLHNRNTSNIGKTINGLNFSSFCTEDQTKPNSKQTKENKSLFSELKSDINSGFCNFSRKVQFSLSSLFCSYYYRLQVSNLNKFMKDLAVLKLSDDKNNLNGNNKNLNEEEVNFKLNDASKGNKNSNSNNNNNDENNNNNNNNSINYIKITLLGISCYVFLNYLSELQKEKNKILISLQEFMDKIGSNSIKKIGLVFHDDKTNKVNVYAVDNNDNTYKINEQFDKELFLKKIQENSSSQMSNSAAQQNASSLNIVYEYTDDLKNRNLLFIGLLALLLVAEKIIRQNNLAKTLLHKTKLSKGSSTSTNTNAEKNSSNNIEQSILNAFEALKAKLGFAAKDAEGVKEKEKLSSIKFSDVAGLHNTKQEVKEFVEFLKHGDKYTELGARIPRGAIFTGPPGTGKTLLAKAIAGEADVNFYFKAGSEFQKMYVGEGAADLRKLFEKARETAPSIIFIDEIDSIGKKRDSSRAQIRDDDGILNQLLVEMDGFSTDKNVIVFAATNRADLLDSALMRSGRFDRKIEFTNPNEEERVEILKLYLQKVKLDKPDEIDLYAKRLAELTANFSGADLANMVNEAAIITARESKEAVDAVSFEKAFDRVYYGLERKKPNSRVELNHISIYESAKVVCSWLLENVKPIIRVSILPKTKKKSSVNEDKVLYTKEELFERITLCLSGRAAEQHYLGKTSTLSADDLQVATRLAEKMMKNLGMSKLGNITAKNFGEKNLSIIDEEIREILHLASEKSKELIAKNSDKIISLRDTLLKKESLDYEGLKEVLGPLPKFNDVDTEEESEKQKISASI